MPGVGPPGALPVEAEAMQLAALLVERDLIMLGRHVRLDVDVDEEGFVFCRLTGDPDLSQNLYVHVGFEEEAEVAKTAVLLAEAAQDSDLFDDFFEPWPRCDLHPESTHSLIAKRFGDRAVWCCPASGERRDLVGSLGV